MWKIGVPLHEPWIVSFLIRSIRRSISDFGFRRARFAAGASQGPSSLPFAFVLWDEISFAPVGFQAHLLLFSFIGENDPHVIGSCSF